MMSMCPCPCYQDDLIKPLTELIKDITSLLNQSTNCWDEFEKIQEDIIRGEQQADLGPFRKPLDKPLTIPKFCVTRWDGYLEV
jgi:hypothetical protein